MKSVLSTKILSPFYQKKIKELGVIYEEYNAITIDFIDFRFESDTKNLIFTSQNAILSFLKNKNIPESFKQKSKCFCVGKKTKSLLEINKMEVLVCCDNSFDLGNTISKYYSSLSFIYYCGNKRREELPKMLEANNVVFSEIEVYKTSLNILSFDSNFDAVLFYSPSAVMSYTKLNELKLSVAFCIGTTTAKEAEKKASHIITAKKPATEDLINEMLKYSRKLKKENEC